MRWVLVVAIMLAGCTASPGAPINEAPLSSEPPMVGQESENVTKRVNFTGSFNHAMECWFPEFVLDSLQWHDLETWTWGGTYTTKLSTTVTYEVYPFITPCVWFEIDNRLYWQDPSGTVPEDTTRFAVAMDVAYEGEYEMVVTKVVPRESEEDDD